MPKHEPVCRHCKRKGTPKNPLSNRGSHRKCAINAAMTAAARSYDLAMQLKDEPTEAPAGSLAASIERSTRYMIRRIEADREG